jgi:hypothetical protein
MSDDQSSQQQFRRLRRPGLKAGRASTPTAECVAPTVTLKSAGDVDHDGDSK